MATKQEKNTLGKVSVILQVTWLSLQSATNALLIYAPNQKRLITILRYISVVMESIIKQKELPEVPSELASGNSFEIRSTEEPLETVDDYRDVTSNFNSPDAVFDLAVADEDDEIPRTK